MVDSDFIPPLTNLGDQGDLRAALVRRVPYTFTATDNPEDFTAVDAGTGSIPWALVWAGTLFYFDPNDLTTAHDGITTLVTLDGYRYKTDDVAGERRSVKSRTTTAPPTGPALGDSYLVPIGASGAWATHPNNIAVWTARGWAYIPPEVGQLVFVEDEGGFYHYGTGGAWIAGIGGSALGAGTVKSSSLIGGRTHWVVVNQTTNAPPPSPANGVAYIVGPAPTGAWAGQSGRIAVWEINTWAFYTPLEGWTAYDQDMNVPYVFNGAWIAQASGYDEILSAWAGTSISPSTSGSGNYSFAPNTAPTTSSANGVDSLTLVVQAAFAGQPFDVDYQVAANFSGSNVQMTVGLFVDSESSARDWMPDSGTITSGVWWGYKSSFQLTLNDTSPHTIRFRFFGSVPASLSRRRIISKRRAA